VHRITNDSNSYSELCDRDSRTLVAQFTDFVSDIWILRNEGSQRSQRITSGGKDGIGGLSWTPDGRIVYACLSRESYYVTSAVGNNAIWLVDGDGKIRNDSLSLMILTLIRQSRAMAGILFSAQIGAVAGAYGEWTLMVVT